MKKRIKKIAVLGSGVMGSRIACHFANIGMQVLLLDVVPRELSEAEKANGINETAVVFRNRIVNDALQAAIKSNPSPLYKKAFAQRINTGNFDDNLKDIALCDWIIEVVVENLEIKKSLFERVEKYRTAGTIVTSNTSGIPIHLLIENRSEDFQAYFAGTHFFNPPRYLPLLEIIPTKKTTSDVTSFLLEFGEKQLGKTTVLCNDTPAFIANRIGVFAIMDLFHQMKNFDFSVEDVDKLTGPVLGRPKSATFRTCDVVGLDTLVRVANDLSKNLIADDDKATFELPEFISKMIANNWIGDKAKQGFYKKQKSETGKSEILSLDLLTLAYKPQTKRKLIALDATKNIDQVAERLPLLFNTPGAEGQFFQTAMLNLFHYASLRVGEISDSPATIDSALKAGFGWELGPFEMWDILGVKTICELLQSKKITYGKWVDDMLASGINTFYSLRADGLCAYMPESKTQQIIKSKQNHITLNYLRPSKKIWGNAGCSIIDLGNDVLCCEFHSKMNTVGSEILQGVAKAIELAEKDFGGLVIGNQGTNFCAGANLALVYMLAIEQDWDEIALAVRAFQQMTMRIRYSSIPVVVAPFALNLGGGCEMSLHADKVVAAAETYTGLVEVGVGLIPAGAGTKEFALRLSDSFIDGDIEINNLKERFMTIAMAKVSTSAHEAFDLGLYRPGQDEIVINKELLISEAKRAVLELMNEGYKPLTPRKDIKVLGKQGLGAITAAAGNMRAGNYISDHDQLISEKLAYVLCGGDLSSPSLVSENYLLELEKEAFLSLCGTRKTLERIKSILTTGKPLRN